MLAADIVIAADDCRFAQLEVRRGIMASQGATIRMVERAGWGNAQTLLADGRGVRRVGSAQAWFRARGGLRRQSYGPSDRDRGNRGPTSTAGDKSRSSHPVNT
jgi:hypothetical protein